MAERLTRNEQVRGSIPRVGFRGGRREKRIQKPQNSLRLALKLRAFYTPDCAVCHHCVTQNCDTLVTQNVVSWLALLMWPVLLPTGEVQRVAGKVHLTKRLIEGLEHSDHNYTVWDDETKGLGLVVTKGGVKSFVLDYTTHAGRRRRLTVGRFGVFTVDQARDEARSLSAVVARGGDPLTTKEAARAEDTVKTFASEYLAHMEAHKKPASLRADRYAIEKMILPTLGSRKLSAVTREDVARLHRSYAAQPYQANRMLATFRHLYTTAAAWGRVGQAFNPCQHVPKFKESKRERFLDADELSRLGVALNSLEEERPYQVRAIRLLLLTGCRLNEYPQLGMGRR